MTSTDPLYVERVSGVNGGSHIEPPFREWWEPHTKLRWWAGALLVDEGIRVEVERFENESGTVSYSISIGNAMRCGLDYHEAWDMINFISGSARDIARTYTSDIPLDHAIEATPMPWPPEKEVWVCTLHNDSRSCSEDWPMGIGHEHCGWYKPVHKKERHA